MREYSEEYILEMREKLETTKHNAGYFMAMAKEDGTERLRKKADRMVQCLDLMIWDKYEQNRLLDLQKVNRCKDRFCPNCRSVGNSLALVKLERPFKEMLANGYMPYLMTLTVPNVPGEQLNETIENMQKAFQKFYHWLGKDDHKGFSERIFDVRAAIKSLEITIEEKRSNYYHPHFHIMVFLQNECEHDFEKYIPDGKRRKGGDVLLSDADVFISKLWTMAYDKTSLKAFKKLPDEIIYTERVRNYYMCDIRPMTLPDGLYEVFKYCFKDSDIKTLKQFKTIFKAVDGKRLRQGHGLLYNLKLECEEEEQRLDPFDDIATYLEQEETPQRLLTKSLEELTSTFKMYKKISRFLGSVYQKNEF